MIPVFKQPRAASVQAAALGLQEALSGFRHCWGTKGGKGFLGDLAINFQTQRPGDPYLAFNNLRALQSDLGSNRFGEPSNRTFPYDNATPRSGGGPLSPFTFLFGHSSSQSTPGTGKLDNHSGRLDRSLRRSVADPAADKENECTAGRDRRPRIDVETRSVEVCSRVQLGWT